MCGVFRYVSSKTPSSVAKLGNQKNISISVLTSRDFLLPSQSESVDNQVFVAAYSCTVFS